jgi:cell division protein FtsA
MIMKKQAEQLKKKFGSALATEMKDNEIVCIPGLQGRAPREISLRNLAAIIEARMTEIIEHVHYEIRNSGYGDQLIGGIVITGGGAQLRNVTQLFEYVTGYDCRIGYPSEHLGEAPDSESTGPTFATSVGLVIKGYDRIRPRAAATAVSTEKQDTRRTREEDRTSGPRFLEKLKEFFINDEID